MNQRCRRMTHVSTCHLRVCGGASLCLNLPFLLPLLLIDAPCAFDRRAFLWRRMGN